MFWLWFVTQIELDLCFDIIYQHTKSELNRFSLSKVIEWTPNFDNGRTDGRTHARTGVTLNASPPFFEWRGHKKTSLRAQLGISPSIMVKFYQIFTSGVGGVAFTRISNGGTKTTIRARCHFMLEALKCYLEISHGNKYPPYLSSCREACLISFLMVVAWPWHSSL